MIEKVFVLVLFLSLFFAGCLDSASNTPQSDYFSDSDNDISDSTEGKSAVSLLINWVDTTTTVWEGISYVEEEYELDESILFCVNYTISHVGEQYILSHYPHLYDKRGNRYFPLNTINYVLDEEYYSIFGYWDSCEDLSPGESQTSTAIYELPLSAEPDYLYSVCNFYENELTSTIVESERVKAYFD